MTSREITERLSNSQKNVEMTKIVHYSQTGNPAFESVMARRSAANEGAFFLKHLRKGMNVLDVGCGPGSITLGFSEVVAPGEVIGVDFQQSQVAQAQTLRIERGIKNARFEVADAYKLPLCHVLKSVDS